MFVNGTEIHKFEEKDSEVVAKSLCPGSISKDWSVENMKITGCNDYDFSVNFDAIAVDDILEIHKYLMKKNNVIKKCLDLLKKMFWQ